MGRCLQNVGVRNEDSRDNFGRFRFLPFPAGTHVGHILILTFLLGGKADITTFYLLDETEGMEQSWVLVLEGNKIQFLVANNIFIWYII